MTKNEFLKLIQIKLEEYDFKKCKDGFLLVNDEVVCLVEIQKSKYSKGFYVNARFYNNSKLSSDGHYSKDKILIIFRFDNGNKKDVFDLSVMSDSEIHQIIDWNITNRILPLMTISGIRTFLDQNPKFKNIITLEMKKVLNI